MTLLFKQSGETNKEPLCVKLGDDQGIMRKIQAGCVSWLVNLLGISWSSSLFRAQFSPIVQHLVVQNGLGGIDSSEKYSACKTATNKSEFYFLQSIQQTQNKTVKQHSDKIRELVMNFRTEARRGGAADKARRAVRVGHPQALPRNRSAHDHFRDGQQRRRPVLLARLARRPLLQIPAHRHRATCTHARLPVHAHAAR